MNKLVVLGSVNADHVLQVPSFPRPGETLHGHNYKIIPGGKGANQAVAAARCGAKISFIASVGDDAFGHQICKEFAADGMNIDGVMMAKNTPTGIAMIQVAETGENSICISSEANGLLTPTSIKPYHHLIKDASMLLMQLETPIETIKIAAQIAKDSGTKVILNPAPAQTLSDDLLKLVDMITPNETEAEKLTAIKVTDLNSAKKAADVLHKKGIELVMITLGSNGVWLSENGAAKQIKGFQVKAVDTTAAGDTFNGALVTKLLEGDTLCDSICFAHAAAAITVTALGAQSSIPYRSDVENFLKNNTQL